MTSRFESLILGAVAIGALTLAACSSSGGSGNKDTAPPDETPTPSDSSVMFLGGRATTPTQLRLYFSDAVVLPDDTGALAGMFTLNQTRLTAAITYSSKFFCGAVVHGTASYYCQSSQGHYFVTNGMDFHPEYVSASGSEVAAISNVALDPDDSSRVLLDLTYSIHVGGLIVDGSGGKGLAHAASRGPVGGDDGYTGALRLTYTGGADGLLDSAGDIVADLTLPDHQLGDVGANYLRGPVLESARTIDSTHVQLVFSEPVHIADGDPIAAGQSFKLTTNCLGYVRLSYQRQFFTGGGPGHGNGLPGLWQSVGSPMQYVTSAHFVSIGPTPSAVIESLSISADAPNIATLVLQGAVPVDANNEGRLRLTYTAGAASELANVDGIAMSTLTLATNHPGNVIDSVNNSNICRANLTP